MPCRASSISCADSATTGSTTRWIEPFEEALGDTTRPLVLAAVTTAAGFLSLLAAGMEPVRELGVFAAVGILVSLAVNLLLGPFLIRRLKVPEAATAADPEFHGRWLHLGSSRPRTVVVVAVLLVLGALASLPFIRVASNPLGFLPEDHPTSEQYRRVSESLSGFYTLEVVLDLPGVWTDPAAWSSVDALAEELAASSIVAKVVSPLDLLRKLEQWDHDMAPSWYRLPQSGADAEALLDDARLRAAGKCSTAWLTRDGRTVRLSAIVNEMDEHLFLDLEKQARQALDELPSGFSGRVTGQVLQLVNAQQTLVASQLRSLAFALLVVFIVVGVGLRSAKLTVLSVLPNAVPLLAAFAVMAVAGITLDAATIMVASIALGIAVDDTVHLLVAIDREEPTRNHLPTPPPGARARRVGVGADHRRRLHRVLRPDDLRLRADPVFWTPGGNSDAGGARRRSVVGAGDARAVRAGEGGS